MKYSKLNSSKLAQRVVWAAIFAGCFVWAVVPVNAEKRKETSNEAASAVEMKLLESVKFLSSDERQGRGIGTDGINQAADYIHQQFAEAGLDVTRVDGGPFQEFSMTHKTELGEPNSVTLSGPHDIKLELKQGTDFQACSFGGSGDISGEIVFVGYGIDAPKENYQEFERVDVKDKIVLLMRRTPQQGNPHSPFAGSGHGRISRHAELRTKVSNAFTRGAKAVFIVNDQYSVDENKKQDQAMIDKATARALKAARAVVGNEGESTDDQQKKLEALADSLKQLDDATESAKKSNADKLMKFGHGGDRSGKSIPVIHITQEIANKLLGVSLHANIQMLAETIDEELKPQSQLVKGWTAAGTVTVNRVEVSVKNVIGVLEGSGPLANETVVIGAHYDHLGSGGEGSLLPGSTDIHNGADDNASGTAALLHFAHQMAQRKEPLPRRLVFIAFTAEERGLIGSDYYVKNPLYPLKETVAMFNMDMVGRLSENKLTIFGTGTAPRWDGLLRELGEKHQFNITSKPDGFGPSDQTSFYARKIPVLHLFTGTHTDYHRPTDDWDKINVGGMSRVVDLLEEIVVATAENPKRPEYLQVKTKTSANRGGSRPYFGSIPDFGTNQPGYAISGASPGSPADKGGLKGGDIIVQLGKQKIGSLNDFDLALRKFSAGDEISVVVLRDGKKVPLKVILAKPR